MVYHDPCYLGRYRDVYDEPREVAANRRTVMEPPRARERSFCCGAGGGQMFLGEEKGKRVNVERVEELVATGAPTIGTACPFCQTMFRDALEQLRACKRRPNYWISRKSWRRAAGGFVPEIRRRRML